LDDVAVRLVGELVPATPVHGRLGRDLVVRSCRVSAAELSAPRMQSSNRWALCSVADDPRRSDGGVPLRSWSLVRSRCDPAGHRTTRRILGDFSYGSTTGALEPGSTLRRCTREVPRRDRGRGLEVRDGRGNEGPGGELLIHGCMKAPKACGRVRALDFDPHASKFLPASRWADEFVADVVSNPSRRTITHKGRLAVVVEDMGRFTGTSNGSPTRGGTVIIDFRSGGVAWTWYPGVPCWYGKA